MTENLLAVLASLNVLGVALAIGQPKALWPRWLVLGLFTLAAAISFATGQIVFGAFAAAGVVVSAAALRAHLTGRRQGGAS